MSPRPLNDSKDLHSNSSLFHLDSGLETQSDCSPRGSILLATSDDDLLPTSTVSMQKAIPHTRRAAAPRTVRFADKPPLTSVSPPSGYTALSKSGKAKKIAKTTLHGAGSVAEVLLGCMCCVFATVCINDSEPRLSGGESRVIAARPGGKALSQRRVRVVKMDMAGYAGYHGDTEKRRQAVARAGVPHHVRVAQPACLGTARNSTHGGPLRQRGPNDENHRPSKQSVHSAPPVARGSHTPA